MKLTGSSGLGGKNKQELGLQSKIATAFQCLKLYNVNQVKWRNGGSESFREHRRQRVLYKIHMNLKENDRLVYLFCCTAVHYRFKMASAVTHSMIDLKLVRARYSDASSGVDMGSVSATTH